MKHKAAKIVTAALLASVYGSVNAQFNTIQRSNPEVFEILTKGNELASDTDTQYIDTITVLLPSSEGFCNKTDTLTPEQRQNFGLRKKHLGFKESGISSSEKLVPYVTADYRSLPKLTITNLLDEIRRNGIRHEKIVLAQAILETGWFTSSVCRHKNNLFGLTNPRTGRYYEFRHWTESVRAYYDKVQYRYKGGNYLLWLKDIGYAEDPRYVSSLIRILRQYMM